MSNEEQYEQLRQVCLSYKHDYENKEKQVCELHNQIAELQKQLKTQPTEIVEKIRKFIHSGEYDNFGVEYLMNSSAILEFLDTILKEYGEKDL